MYRVLTATNIVGEDEIYSRYSDNVEYVKVAPERTAILKAIPDCDAFITPLAVRTDREILDAGRKLKALFTATTGLDHIELGYAAEKGIAVYGMKNDRDFLDGVTATAEMALALLLALVRHVPWSFDSVKSGEWDREKYRGHQLSGKTMGILGYGRLGTILAEYAKALRMRVIACDLKKIEDPEVEQVTFDELLARSDVISIHVHMCEENRGLFGKEAFARLKKGCVLINTSRGAIVDESAMLDALENGTLSGAGLDVIDGEWMEEKSAHPLIRYANTHRNLLISPHTGGCCFEAQTASLANTLEKVADFFAGGCDPAATETLVRSRVN